MQTLRALLVLSALLPVSALAQTPAPPDLDCSAGFDGLRSAAAALPGAQRGNDGRFDLVTQTEPDVWKVEFAFTAPGQAAHPAVTLRTFLKQVTGVWTAQSKGCSFGDERQFAALMADMKQRDSELTNVSRAEVEAKKKEASPLGAP
ncbi:MAG: hypothetical protein Q7T86_03775 [Hyphomicrobiaceae bacterium]|jgi:hypothetical protein|nr:hypothetical protein [Hyphomicrobiaceae bacterium]